jgi:hypothetical protein
MNQPTRSTVETEEEEVSERHNQKRASMVDSLENQTGQSLEDWAEVITENELSGFKPIVDWLKQEHGLGHFQARLIAEAYRDRHT